MARAALGEHPEELFDKLFEQEKGLEVIKQLSQSPEIFIVDAAPVRQPSRIDLQAISELLSGSGSHLVWRAYNTVSATRFKMGFDKISLFLNSISLAFQNRSYLY